MSVIVLLIAAGGVVAGGFLAAFVWAVRTGQFDDTDDAGRARAARRRRPVRPSIAAVEGVRSMSTSVADPAPTPPARAGAAAVETFAYDNAIVRQLHRRDRRSGASSRSSSASIVALKLVLPGLPRRSSRSCPTAGCGRCTPTRRSSRSSATRIFVGVYYSLQRLCKARMFSDRLSAFHFWGWQLIIVAAALTLPLGFTTSKEYAELEWPIDIAIALVWVVFGVNMLGTIVKRRERHLYVAIWFYLATFITVALLHVVNSLELPVSLLKSYSMYAGVQDALVQWWYGHNAVAFFLTTPFLGIMYYFLPEGGESAGVLATGCRSSTSGR